MMWDGLVQMGFRGGMILEPALGTGHFLGAAPADIVAKSRFTGIEIDPVAARISAQLYPDIDLHAAGFEDVAIPEGFYDVVITNVPFGQIPVSDPKYNRAGLSIHNYFLHKSLALLRPGGVLLALTSTATLDNQDPHARDLLHRNANLLGAWRLPSGAFASEANTQVSTDLLVLQKRPEPMMSGDPERYNYAWRESQPLTVEYQSFHCNQYFIDHPDRVLGQFKSQRMNYGATLGVAADPDWQARLGQALAQLPDAGMITPDLSRSPAPRVALSRQTGDLDLLRDGSFVLLDNGEIGTALTEKRLEPDENGDMQVSMVRVAERYTPANAKQADRIRAMIPVRDALRALLDAQVNNAPDTQISAHQASLNAAYDACVAVHGPLNGAGNRRAFASDPALGLLLALEDYDEASNTAKKSAIFTERVIAHANPVESTDSAFEALALALSQTGRVDTDMMAQLTGRDWADLREELGDQIFKDPNEHRYLPAAEYLAGNVRVKLRVAQVAARLDPEEYQRNVAALEAVQPKDLEPADIHVRLGASWLPPADVADFAAYLLDLSPRNVSVHFGDLDGSWELQYGVKPGLVASTQTWGTARMPADKILDALLNQRPIKVMDTHRDGRSTVNVLETTSANTKASAIGREFSRWLWDEPARRERLLRLYNDTMNNMVLPRYDGSHLQMPGMNALVKLRPHQKDAVWRGVQTRRGLNAHKTGAGKTYVQVATAIELKRLGLAHKPMVLVPNHMLDQFAGRAQYLYPGANILAVRKEDLSGDRRTRFLGRVATGNWDLVVITHSTFGRIGLGPRVMAEMVEEQIREYQDFLRRYSGKTGRRIKEVQRKLRALETEYKELAASKDDRVHFEELGVDFLLVDESHLFKNLEIKTRMEVSGVPTGGSDRARDLYLKSRYIMRQRSAPEGLIFSSATPISNTLAEIYVNQKYLQPDVLESRGETHFDAWAANYMEQKPHFELTVDGSSYHNKVRLSPVNIPELMSAFCQVMDVKTQADLNLPEPAVARETIVAPQSERFGRFMQHLAWRAWNVRQGHVDPSEDNLLKISSDGRKASLDLRLLAPGLPDDPDSKINECVANLLRVRAATAEQRGTQLVFCDMGTPKADAFNIYDDVRAKLIAAGVPAAEIAFIHDAKTDAAKEALYEQVRQGIVRELLGSTEKMGVGTEVQDRLVAIHHLDAPWRPTDIEQRDGRGVRQGNLNDSISIYTYTTADSFDLFMWQTLRAKAEAIGRVMKYDPSIRRLDLEVEPSYAEIMALTTKNPAIRDKIEVDQAISQLELQARAHADQCQSAARMARFATGTQKDMRRRQGLYQDLAARRDPDAGWTLDGKPVKPGELEDYLHDLKLGERIPPIHTQGLPLRCHPRDKEPWELPLGDKESLRFSNPGSVTLWLNQQLERSIAEMARRQKELTEEIQQFKAASREPFPDADRLAELDARRAALQLALDEAGVEQERPQPVDWLGDLNLLDALAEAEDLTDAEDVSEIAPPRRRARC